MVPPDFRSKEGGVGDLDVELLYRVFPMNSTYRYLPIYTELLDRVFPMKSTYRYRYLKPRISQRILNLVQLYYVYHGSNGTWYLLPRYEIMSSRAVVQQRARRFTPILGNNDLAYGSR